MFSHYLLCAGADSPLLHDIVLCYRPKSEYTELEEHESEFQLQVHVPAVCI